MKTYSIIKQEECQGMTYYVFRGTNVQDVKEKDVAIGSTFFNITNSTLYGAYYESGVLKWKDLQV